MNDDPSKTVDPSGAALGRLRALYAELDAEIAALAPKCELSGRCCDFKRSGLTLFSTDLELEWLRRTAPPVSNGDPALCPHWRDGLCEARVGRPLGCRVYFCDESRTRELEEISARYHARLKRIHDESGFPYRYAPFVTRVRAPLAAKPPLAR